MPHLRQDPKSGGIIFDLTKEEENILNAQKELEKTKKEYEERIKKLDEYLKKLDK